MLVDFYHLAVSPLEKVLPSICEKLLASGERLLLVADAAQLDRLDDMLWTYARDSFLPHGRRERANPELQPILLSDNAESLNSAGNIALADGRWRDEALAFRRTFYLFDTSNLIPARAAWKALATHQPAERRYWKQADQGRWVQEA